MNTANESGVAKHSDHVIDAQPVPPKRWLNRTVAGVGLTSALGDFCYETATVIPARANAVIRDRDNPKIVARPC